MAAEGLLHVTDQDFEKEIIQAQKPALVDFWAPWCGPCRVLGPVIEELAGEYGDRVVISKLNVDDNPKTSSKFGIRSIPTLLLFKDGKVVDSIIGVVPKGRIEEIIKKVL
ncbi:MAG TPA: thioredoxin [Syntrophales bacterium]|nr:thioredoxin [Syntrophales bacterium]HOM06390.1 thioredoxin [Syntrophales bacterium]HON99159.1 thioredoxin [Syntrophales bacterium]HPC00267.1 thioredoxin [Syntrophales bacterium]HPQ05930.1 thioredoxin [Syntrophales bacterium]